MLERLRAIHQILHHHADQGSADTVAKLVSLYEKDRDSFWDLLTSDEVWGGAGSLADKAMLSSPRSDAERRRDRHLVWSELVGIADEMEAAGRLNERTLMWASAFRGWLREGL